jgi:3-oxoacyl-(acyl-carrier-protein) synthase
MSLAKGGGLAITGIGCICGFGVGVSAFERGLFEGRSAVAPVTAFDTSRSRAHLGAHIADFDPAAYIQPAKLRRIDRVGRLAVASCKLALDDAALSASDPLPGADRIGVALGSYTAGIHSLVDYLDRLIAQGPTGASALDFSNTVGNAAASLCGIEFGLRGPNVTLNSKEASGLSALTHAVNLVRSGQSSAIVTGAVDDFESMFFAVHDRFGALASDQGDGEASRPFDRRRNGFVLGSGAFVVVVESAGEAEARRARRRGSIAGLGATSSRCAMNGWPEEPSQLVRCMRQALADAELEPRDVSVVFAAANSTPELDRVEADALADVFGPSGVPVVALKGALGESSASAAAGVAAAVLSLERRVAPPTVGFEQADAHIDLDIVRATRPLDRHASPAALVNAFASGGANYSAVVRT